MLQYGFMQNAVVAALLVGLMAPIVGVHLVQRRMSIIGDGIGHVALSGVALGLLTGWAPVGTAMVVAVAGAVVMELLRGLRRNEIDVLMAVLFAAGIAGGVVLLSWVPSSRSASSDSYLFGATVTTTDADLVVLAATAAVVLAVSLGLRRAFLAVSLDEAHARASGLPVTSLNCLLMAMTAATVVASMRILGLLLISALIVLPAAVAMLLTRSFAATVAGSVVVGVVCALAGTTAAFYAGLPTGGTIVLLAVALFLVVSGAPSLRRLLDRAPAAAARGRIVDGRRGRVVAPSAGLLP